MKKCNKCKVERPLTEFHKNKTKKDGLQYECKSCMKAYQKANKEKIKVYKKTWREANKDEINAYREANKEYFKSYSRVYQRERLKTDSLFRMKRNLRKRTWEAFKNKGYKKTSKTQEMLGVDWKVAKAHIERQFTKGMNWDNQGEWHIDHIIPLASANTEEELKKLCHYTNLQPLWAEENKSKSDKIDGQQIKFRI